MTVFIQLLKFKQCLYLTQISKQMVKLWKIDPFSHSMSENRQFARLKVENGFNVNKEQMIAESWYKLVN